eukprot:751317-Hanusia_phi.AAC.5
MGMHLLCPQLYLAESQQASRHPNCCLSDPIQGLTSTPKMTVLMLMYALDAHAHTDGAPTDGILGAHGVEELGGDGIRDLYQQFVGIPGIEMLLDILKVRSCAQMDFQSAANEEERDIYGHKIGNNSIPIVADSENFR